MADYNDHNHISPDHHAAHDHDEVNTVCEIPPDVDRSRPPHRNDDNTSSHHACLCSRNSAAGGTDSLGTNPQPVPSNSYSAYASSEAGSDDQAIDGDEGVEGHKIKVGPYGLIPLVVIHQSLARHDECTCHHGILPGSDDYPFTTYPSPTLSHSPSGTSLHVEASSGASGDQSMISSSIFSFASRNSSAFFFSNGGFAQERVLQPFPVLFNPLRLTPDVAAVFEYPMEVSVGEVDIGLEMGGGSRYRPDFGECDFW